jgi:hypothetical protein
MEKDGFIFARNQTNEPHQYLIQYVIENKSIHLQSMIDLPFLQLIFDLNSDIFESYNIQYISDSEILLTFVLKHFFQDLGMPQHSGQFRIIKQTHNGTHIIFYATSIEHTFADEIIDIHPMNINASFQCNESPHIIHISAQVIQSNSAEYMPPFMEKMTALILFKIMKRVKQFIDNMTIKNKNE